jgi:hypothetical protein
MDFYQGIVIEYIRADRAVFVNPQSCIQLNDHPNPDVSGPHWYCDAIAADFRSETIFLCEVSYAHRLQSLLSRLTDWNQHWDKVREALTRDHQLPSSWKVRVWLFVPHNEINFLDARLKTIGAGEAIQKLQPRITQLEAVQPWQYRSWNHRDSDTDKSVVPEQYRG